MEFNLADLFELVADRVPDRLALVAGDRRLTFRELDERATRFANYLVDVGVEPGQHVGIYSVNRAEWVEAMFGCYKARAVPINVNYRYVADELRYLFDNADLVALVYEAEFGPLVASVLPGLPQLEHLVVLDDGIRHRHRRARRGRVRARARVGVAGTRRSGPAPPTTSTSSTPAAPPACPRA